MVDRNILLDRLQKLNESQIEELRLRLSVDKFHLRWSGVTLNQKVIDLIEYLAQQEQGLQDLQDLLEQDGIVETDSIPTCPYRGLLAFQEKHAEFFFGRDAFINDVVEDGAVVRQGLVQAVKTKPLVAVVGASGSGKSSLVFAGLIPRLRKLDNWLIDSFRPKHQPFDELAAALVRQLEPELGETARLQPAAELAAALRQRKVTLQQVVARIEDRRSRSLLLIADQFEELYTLSSEGERLPFLDFLLAGIGSIPELKWVLTLRADFCGQAYAYRPFADALHGADVKLGPMNLEELQAAIVQPAQKMGVQIEDGLVDRILDDVGQEPGNLPLLEFALTELWKKQRRRQLTHQAYTEIGEVTKALANHAETVYQGLSEENQKRAQRIFLQLVRPGEGTEDTRRVATRAEVGVENWDLVTVLAGDKTRLVVTGRNEETVEVVHEALLREWKLLRRWMESDRAFRLWQEGLRFVQRQWQRSGKDEGALLEGVLLSEAEAWLSKRQPDLSGEEEEFIRLSLEVRDRRIKERLDQLQEIVDSQKKALQAEVKATEKEREAREQAEKTAKAERLKSLVTRVAAGLAIATIIAWVVVWQRNQQLKSQEAVLDAGLTGVNPTIAQYIWESLPGLSKKSKAAKQKADASKKEEDIKQALTYYRQLRIRTINLLTKIEKQRDFYNKIFSHEHEVKDFSKEAEESLADLISRHRLNYLQKDLENKKFQGRISRKDFYDFEKQFLEGSLKTTYQILMQDFGVKADINENGILDSEEESNQIPCKTLKDIQDLWLEYTKKTCRWHGSDSEYFSKNAEKYNKYLANNTSCSQLSKGTLTSQLFNFPNDELILNRLEECKTTLN